MSISQSADSLTVRRIVVDSASQKLLTTSSALYLIGREWTGAFDNPPGSSITTKGSWVLTGRMLELSTTVRAPRAAGVMTWETLQVGPGDKLVRNVREMDLLEGKVRGAKSDTWARVI